VLKEFSSLNEVHNEVDAVALLENIVEADYEGMVHLQQNQPLKLERLNALVLNHHILADDLHGKQLVVKILAHEVNLTEGAASNNTDQLKIGKSGSHESVASIKSLRLGKGLLRHIIKVKVRV
jgi:hypothetical protein